MDNAKLSGTCVACRQPFYYKPAEKAEAHGHVYSEMGLKETRISGLCEYCFDEIADDRDDKWGDEEDDNE